MSYKTGRWYDEIPCKFKGCFERSKQKTPCSYLFDNYEIFSKQNVYGGVHFGKVGDWRKLLKQNSITYFFSIVFSNFQSSFPRKQKWADTSSSFPQKSSWSLQSISSSDKIFLKKYKIRHFCQMEASTEKYWQPK